MGIIIPSVPVVVPREEWWLDYSSDGALSPPGIQSFAWDWGDIGDFAPSSIQLKKRGDDTHRSPLRGSRDTIPPFA